jgi:flagellar biogenesis protein FliO
VKEATAENATKEFVEKVVAESKTDMIKWLVGLFFALAVMIIGLYFRK